MICKIHLHMWNQIWLYVISRFISQNDISYKFSYLVIININTVISYWRIKLSSLLETHLNTNIPTGTRPWQRAAEGGTVNTVTAFPHPLPTRPKSGVLSPFRLPRPPQLPRGSHLNPASQYWSWRSLPFTQVTREDGMNVCCREKHLAVPVLTARRRRGVGNCDAM